MRGNDVRIVEERQNAAFARTLRAVGASASRHFHDRFPLLQHNTYEPRTGARLLEWVARELALIDVAVAVQGLDEELCRWIANVDRERMNRAYLAWEPELLTADIAERLELARFDFVIAPHRPPVELPWECIEPVVAGQDAAADLAPPGSPGGTDPIAAAAAFERLFLTRR